MSNYIEKLVAYKTHQSGIVMFVTLIALVIMLLASIALIRSTDTNLLIAGHISFKRDLVNQAERAIPLIRAQFKSGGLLPNETIRATSLATANYSATILPSNSNASSNNLSGIPNILMDINAFDGTYSSNNIVNSNAQITIRYIVDRMCLNAGQASPENCTLSLTTQDGSGSGVPPEIIPGINLPVYRISMRVTGPRNTETFLQTSFRF